VYDPIFREIYFHYFIMINYLSVSFLDNEFIDKYWISWLHMNGLGVGQNHRGGNLFMLLSE
jgi:hypothetical protein